MRLFKILKISLMCPLNLRFFWNLGRLLIILITLQIISGFVRTFYYTLDFYSNLVCHIEVFTGDIVQLIHANFPRFIFFFLYIHIIKGLVFNSFSKIKIVWVSGLVLFVLLIGVSFLGYVLPWGQISLWGATVIINLLTVVPGGPQIVFWIWGGYFVSVFTLKVFYSLHFILPLIIVVVILIHMWLLHFKGSSNSLRIDRSLSITEFIPNFIYKDMLNIVVTILILSVVMWNSFKMLDTENFIKANLIVSPLHIKPEWYLLQFYAILRAIPSKLGGVIIFVSSLLVNLLLILLTTYLNFSRLKFWKTCVRSFICVNLLLIWLGGCPVETPYLVVSQFLTCGYFIIFILLCTIH